MHKAKLHEGKSRQMRSESDDKSALVIYSQTYLHPINIHARYISHKQIVRLSNKTALYFNLTNNNGYKL